MTLYIPASPINTLLGSEATPMCRVISDGISVHWWRNDDDSGICQCGKTRKDKTDREAAPEDDS